PGGPQPDVARQDVDGDPPLGLVFGHPYLGLECHQHDTDIVVFDERSGVLTGAPRRFRLQAVDFTREIELHERLRHRRCMRTTMSLMLRSVRHRNLHRHYGAITERPSTWPH